MNDYLECRICKITSAERVYDKASGYLAFTFNKKKCKVCDGGFYLCSTCDMVEESIFTKKYMTLFKYYYRYVCSYYCWEVWDIIPKENTVNER